MQVLTRAARAEGPEIQAVPAWRIALSGVLSLAGLGLSVYLTVAHFVGAGILVCSNSGAVNCLKVTTSAQSHFLGMPVAVLGLGYWVVMTALNSPWAWRSADRRIHAARLALSVLGIGFVLYLLSAELLIIGAICIYCTGVHIITFAQLVLVMATVPAMLGWGRAPTTAAGRRR
jgi:uncharacterized membrane protein